MIIDFKEIPVANKGGGQQDQFELFACSFLEAIGFEVLRRPDRGPDDKKDMILQEKRNGIGGETVINWLVSCKHFAHSGKSVSDIDEQDISDRVKKHNCQGFIGFYSTIPSSSLSNKLYSLKQEFESLTFDCARIENELLRNKNCATILASFCPNSFDVYQKLNIDKNTIARIDEKLEEEKLISNLTTALIVLEIDKIEEKFEEADPAEKPVVLRQLLRYIVHRNERIADSIFNLLMAASYKTRYLGNSELTSSVQSLVFSYFPSSYNTTDYEIRSENV
jgi:hypothetical protein